MSEDAAIIRMDVSHYRALLKLNMDDNKRLTIKRLLAQALEQLALHREAEVFGSYLMGNRSPKGGEGVS